MDGNNFREIGRVDGADTTIDPQNYSYKDNNYFPNTSYSRLKQTDFDGSSQCYLRRRTYIKFIITSEKNLMPAGLVGRFFVA